MNEDLSGSPAYFIGQVACTMVFPEATMTRDFISNVYSGDYLGAAMDIGGTKYAGKLFTVLKDSSVVTAFVKKVGSTDTEIGNKLMSTLWKQGIYHTELPAADKVGLLDKAFGGAATRLEGQGVADESIAYVYENGGNIGKTLNIVESETSGVQILWLEEGKLGSINANGKDVGIGQILLVLFKDHNEDFSIFHEGDCASLTGRLDVLKVR